MIRRPPRSTLSSSPAASDVYKSQNGVHDEKGAEGEEHEEEHGEKEGGGPGP